MRMFALQNVIDSFYIQSLITYTALNQDHKGVGVAHEKRHPKPASLFPDIDEAVLAS